MIVCGIDFEATDKDPKTARITEVGAALFDTEDNWEVVDRFNCFVFDETYPPQSDEVIDVTGITDEMLRAEGVPFPVMLIDLMKFMEAARGFIAHNKEYDETLFKAEIERHKLGGLPLGWQIPVALPWHCTITDLKSNQKKKCMKLSHLALDYGVAVDPTKLHRAVADVELMGEMLRAAKADYLSMVAYAATPSVFVRIIIPKPWEDEGKGKDAAVKLGFSWEKPRGAPEKRFPQMWVRMVKVNELEELQAQSLYRIKTLEE